MLFSQIIPPSLFPNVFKNLLFIPVTPMYAGQEATVRIEYGTIDWFQTGKGVRQGCIVTLLI